MTCNPELGMLSDFVWHDLNANGIQNISEPGISNEPGIFGATVKLKDANGLVIEETITDENGKYFFEVVPGTYSVQFVLPPGFDAVSPLNATIDDSLDSDADPDMC